MCMKKQPSSFDNDCGLIGLNGIDLLFSVLSEFSRNDIDPFADCTVILIANFCSDFF